MYQSNLIEIDGSYGEGGGQILRTALSLSCLFKRPIRIFNIRKKRKKPGLLPQHLATVKALQLLSSARVEGTEIGSENLYFEPYKISSGNFFYDIGTAGSTLLVFQAILPCLIFAEGKSFITLKGGTNVPFSPSYHYVNGVFRHFLNMIGVNFTLSIDSYGFYPKGGGVIRAEVEPVKRIKSLKGVNRGRLLKIIGKSGVANLPQSIAERQKRGFIENISDIDVPVLIDIEEVNSLGKGTFLYIEAQYERSCAGFAGLGEIGKRAEIIGQEVAKDFIRYNRSNAFLDPHMADQILIYLFLGKKGSEFTTSQITGHLITNLWVINRFIDRKYEIEGKEGEEGRVFIRSVG